jgi:phosphate transport system permease protein
VTHSEPARRAVETTLRAAAFGAAGTPRRRLLADRAGRWVVTTGGMAIIASVLGILVFILIEILPLLWPATVEPQGEFPIPVPSAAILSDEHRSHVAALSPDGWLRAYRVSDGAEVLALQVSGAALSRVGVVPGAQAFAGLTEDGRIVALGMDWDVAFTGGQRVVTPRPAEPVRFELCREGCAVSAFAARLDERGAGAAAAVLDDGTLVWVRREVRVNLFSGESSASVSRTTRPVPLPVAELVLDGDLRNLYGAAPTGELLWWPIAEGEPGDPQVVPAAGERPTALTLLIGDRSLVVGRADGALGVWFPVRQPDETFRLTHVRDFPARPGAIRLLAPSLRNKGFLAQDATGGLGLYHSTSGRVLWQGASPLPGATSLFFTPKADGAFLAGPERVAALGIHNPHPEVSLRALFGRVWYEGYTRPEHVWQSTGGTDDFEPKLNLTPLMFGTLKGTFYSLLLAIPLGVLAAIYASQFLHYSYRRYVKPTVEIMAALPSVVLGFLAGLWLAPRVERILPALALMLVLLPLATLAGGWAWRALPQTFRGRFRPGSETAIYLVLIVLAAWLAFVLGPPWERLMFGGDFQSWLLETTGLRYDQRNAVVVGLAMGFAVIPIIFSIAEDALSNVPRTLIAGSLALGATRWQTVTRVVLPTASPGIFSAVIIGFGRAVGETMIVLMATGNTPVMDWNAFSGFRTLSANIAVEISEAPHGETLYRTLFLSALILFAITFAINTLAELVRQRLRERYSQL